MVVGEEESVSAALELGPEEKPCMYSAHVDAAMADLKELISDKEGNLGVTKRSSDDLITLCSSNGYLVFLFHDAFLNCYCCLGADPLLRNIRIIIF
jgi:CO dehydrogenase/acetyl-CoA synthase gamma subunit (corrinoid Fe-S protein)